MKNFISFPNLLAVALVGLLAVSGTQSIKLDSDGGYSVAVALEPSTVEADLESVQGYIFEIWTTLEEFSHQLFTATEGTFHLKHVDLLVPGTWDISVHESISQSYKTADLKINPSLEVPHVENLHACGLAGDFIELPLHFLDNSTSRVYGEPSKALLNLWARFRYGVWEEHGQPGSNTFPYFYKKAGENDWQATGCSNVELEGTYTDSEGNECKGQDGEKPSDDCRFRPSETNIAKSSLMGFQWLDSVTHFCNDDTHNKVAPNPQNHFCGHRSVWSVIESSPDFAQVTEKATKVPVLEINIMKKRELRPLYILLDKGQPTENAEYVTILPFVIRSLVDFIQQESLKDTVVSVGSFSGTSALMNEVNWLKLDTDANVDKILEAIGNIPADGPKNTDLGKPLLEAINEIGKLDAQSALLILKTGRYSDNYVSSIPEEEILTTLKNNRILVFAAELQNTADDFPKHLTSVATHHLPLKTLESVKTELKGLLDSLTTALTTEPTSPAKETILFKGKVAKGIPTKIPFKAGMERDLKVHLTVQDGETNKPTLTWSQSGSVAPTTNRAAWGEEDAAVGKKIIYTGAPTLDITDPIDEFEVLYKCLTGDECSSVAELIITSSDEVESIGISASVSVSSVDVDFDNLRPGDDPAPFVIFAKIEQRGKSVRNLVVQAFADIGDGSLPTVVSLEDNGLGTPDAFVNDGIYSGMFIPAIDGSYKISVSVQYKKAGGARRDSNKEVDDDAASIRLLPIDQNIPEKEAVELTMSLATVIDFVQPVTFNNVANFKKNPFKVRDLVAYFTSEKEDYVKFTFTSPNIQGSEGKVTKYILQGAKTIEALIHETPDLRSLLDVNTVSDPGQKETIIIPNIYGIAYFQVRANNGVLSSSVSNIVQISGEEPEQEPTTETPENSTQSSGFRESGSAVFALAFVIMVFINLF